MKSLLTFLFLIFFFSVNAQNSSFKDRVKKRFFIQTGIDLDYSLYPVNSEQIETEIYTNQWENTSINLSYIFRLNILEIDSDQSISISTAPALGLSFGFNNQYAQFSSRPTRDVHGVGNLNLPIEFNYHIGKGATKSSTFKYGVTFTFGKEYRLAPLLAWSDLPEYQLGLKKNYEGYILKVGIIREKKRVHEIFVRTVIFEKQPRIIDPFSSIVPNIGNGNFALGFRFFRK